MSRPAVVPSVIETTTCVEPRQAFAFWRATALAPFGDVERVQARAPFQARRLAVAAADWALTHTASSPVGLRFGSGHIDRNAPEQVAIALALDGIGYQEQHDRGGRIAAGDISFLVRNRPFMAGSQNAYEELRIAVPRRMFEAWFGDADAFSGRILASRPAISAFAPQFRAFASSVRAMSHGEADAALDSLLHLLRGLVPEAAGRSRRELSRDAVISLARAQIERRLHDPGLCPRQIHTALGLSRTQLYRAFAETEGIAAEIRTARLTHAYRHLASPDNDGLKIATIAYGCGFTDVPTFNRAFRRRFGFPPGDLRSRDPSLRDPSLRDPSIRDPSIRDLGARRSGDAPSDGTSSHGR
ncbi:MULTISPECIES: helix-turn-helix domain-containing protein [unclassified Methylobacterium]|uniref:helix-turn-helix domain-containing protein n=1 Tax=unclassified Methylobacterium TaxID=2615210 RepID=UPI0009EA382E|nr:MULTISPECIES: helix-turn-helix domain-containing protein [unclassified Methylobacterium]